MYNKLVDILFLPSKEMACNIPNISVNKIVELPSGLNEYNRAYHNSDQQIKLNILYIGGIGKYPNIYNLKLFMETVSDMPDIEFVLCCRRDDWEECRNEYEKYLCNNIQIVHHSGDDIRKLYEQADLFCMFFEPSWYWNFAVPFKFFEAAGYHCPLLSTKELLIGKYIEENNLGFTCEYNKQSLKSLLDRISKDKEQMQQIVKNVSTFAAMNTWEKRCQLVSESLTLSI